MEILRACFVSWNCKIQELLSLITFPILSGRLIGRTLVFDASDAGSNPAPTTLV